MADLAPVRSSKKETILPVILEVRKVQAKLDLFSPPLLLFMAGVLTLALFLTFDSYQKSYRNAQMVRISATADTLRVDNFRKTELESRYLRLMSAPAVAKQAKDLNMQQATKDRVLNF